MAFGHKGAFNAEPNGDLFCCFAEFADLIIRHLGMHLSEEEMEVWKVLHPAFIITLELHTRVYAPFPMDKGYDGIEDPEDKG